MKTVFKLIFIISVTTFYVHATEIDVTPVGEYRFDECDWDALTGQVKDSSNLYGEATASNMQPIQSGVINNHTYFNDKEKGIVIPNNTQVPLNGNLTISLWIKPDEFSSSPQTLLSKSAGDELDLELKKGYLYFSQQGKAYSQSTYELTELNRWYHIAITRDMTTKTLTYYVNNVKVFEETFKDKNIKISTKDIYVGKAVGNAQPFLGAIDELKLYTSALPKAAIELIYNNEKSGKNADGSTRNPVACMQPINCMPTALMFQNKPTDINVLDLMTGDLNVFAADIFVNNVNAVGYNEKDGYFWGSDHTAKDGSLVKIGQDGSGNTVAKRFYIENLNKSSYVGDVDSHGHLYLKDGNNVYVVDLDPASQTYLTLLRSFTLSKSVSTADWAFNPQDDYLYAINGGNGTKYLYKIDPNDGTVLSKIDTKLTGNRGFGANFFDADGFLYSYDNKTGQIFRTDVANNAQTVLFSNGGNKVSLNDGAMCTELTLKFDFGDLPDSYGTTLNSDGARHSLPSATAPSIYMGSTVTHENEGQPSDTANLDNADDGVDMNGSSLHNATIEAGKSYTLEIKVQGEGYLNAWIDWNGDGDFNDENEQIANNLSNTGNLIHLTNTAPSNKTRTTYARFRYSSAPNLLPTGYALNGEVEDYQVYIKGNLQPFTCDDTLYLSNRSELGTGTHDSGATWLHTINQDATYSYTAIGEGYSSDNGGYNALGYNLQDNFMYALYGNKLLKIDKDAKVQELGAVTALSDQQLYAGEFDRDGFFYVTGNGGDDNKMYKIDINQVAVIETITLSESVKFWDMAVDESGDYFYAMLISDGDNDSSYNNDKVAKINKITGDITTLGDSHADLTSYISLVFSDRDGKLFMMSNENGFYSVDTELGSLYPMAATQDLTLYNDGTSCPNASVLGLPRIIVNDVAQKEGDSGLTDFTFTVTFSKATVGESGFNYTLSNGIHAISPKEAALAGEDYQTQSGYIAVPADTKELEIRVKVVGDTEMEQNEEFYLNISNPYNLVLQDNQAVGTIINDDMVLFNVERTNSNTVDNDTQVQKESFYTQIAGRDFDYALVAYNQDQSMHATAGVKGITLKVELLDYNSSTMNDVLYSDYVYFPLAKLQSRLNITKEDDLIINRATRDAGFRVSYLVDENDSIVYGEYNNFEAYNGNKLHYKEVSIGARDNFAIRPASYRISLEGNETMFVSNTQQDTINLIAEHDYNLSMEATQFQSEEMAQNYTTTNKEQVNVTLLFKEKDERICNDGEDYNQSNDTNINYLFKNGEISNSNRLTHNNVGAYIFHVEDTQWTTIDQNSQSDFAGCILNSATISKSGDEKSGCNIASNISEEHKDYTPKHYDLELVFKPYSFDLSSMTLLNLPTTAHNYVYMNNLKDNSGMGVEISGTIRAQGEKGTTLSNFTSTCFAEDIELFIDYNMTTDEGLFSSNFIKEKTEGFFSLLDIDSKILVNPNRIVSHNGVIGEPKEENLHESILVSKSDFLTQNQGSSDIQIIYNVGKSYNKRVNPVKIDFISVKTNASDATVSLNQSRYFYFTRIAPDLENYNTVYERNVATPVTIEIFCENTRAWCTDMIGNNGLNNSNTQEGWYTAQHHDTLTNGTIYEFVSDNEDINLTNMSDALYNDGRFSNIETRYTGDKKTVNVTVDIHATDWLYYHPSAKDGIPFWKIKFKTILVTDPTGIGESNHQIILNQTGIPANRLDY